MRGQKFTPNLHNFGCSTAISPQVGSNVVVSCSLHRSKISSNAPWKVWAAFILQLNVQGFPGCQHHEPHVCTHRRLSWPHPSNLNFYRCLSLAVFQLTPRELRQGTFCWFKPKSILFCFAKPTFIMEKHPVLNCQTQLLGANTRVDIDILSIYL